MVELGERMLLVAILGTVPVLGAFISITAAYHIKLGSVSKQLGCAAVRTMPLPEPATCAPASKLSAIVVPPRCTRRTPGTPHHYHLVRGLSGSNVGCLSPYACSRWLGVTLAACAGFDLNLAFVTVFNLSNGQITTTRKPQEPITCT